MALTELGVQRLSIRGIFYEVNDAGGLAVRVSPKGTKSWVFRYSFDGRQLRMTLGRYPGVSLADARQKAGEAAKQVQQGIDPGQVAREDKAKHKAAPTVSQLLDEFFEIELSKTPSGKERRRLVTKDVIPAWGKRKVKEITRRDAVVLIDKVRKRAPVGASRLQSVMVRMWNFAAERGIIDFSPMVGMRRPKEKPRSRVLDDKEIQKLWAGIDLNNAKIDAYKPTKLALKMILLTGQRPGEVSNMQWQEINEKERLWVIPEERAKNRQENRVPLGQMAMDVLDQAKMFTVPDCDHVFPSSYKKGSPISRAAIGKAVLRHLSELKIKEKFTPHDLRRTVRTRLAEIGVLDVIAERVLGHKLQGLFAVYNQHSYDSEKRQALTRWETRLSEILGHDVGKSGKVLQFSRKGE